MVDFIRDIMKLFQSVQTFYRMTGIFRSQSNQNDLLNFIQVLMMCGWIQGFLFTGAFCLFGAENIQEYGISYYASVTELLNIVCYLSNVWKWSNVVIVIENLECFIDKSNSFLR